MMDDIDTEERGDALKAFFRFLGIVVILGIMAGLGYYIVSADPPPPRGLDGCIISQSGGESAPQRTAILVDATTSIPSEMALAIMPQMSIFIDQKSDPEERFALFSVSDRDYRSAREEAGFCRPSKERGLTKSPQEVEEKWRAFSDELEDVFQNLSSIPESDFSPIMETIDAVTEGENDFNRIVIFSDMVVHMPSKKFTHYASEYAAPDDPHPYLDETGKNLRGMEVIVCYIVRPEESPEAVRQGKDHRDWWRRYFDAKGAKSALIEEVYKTRSGRYNTKCL